MVSILIYDFVFLTIFIIFIVIFLYKNKKNLTREIKVAFLYKTQWGVKLINYVGKKYKRTLGVLQYVIIALGYVLMAGILWMIARSVYIYLTHAKEITDLIKAPPIAPVIPYFPTLFGMRSFFPPFYFTYFLVSLAIVAIVHEFSHGILMRFHNVKIKSTGFLFLGPFLGAFVEQDEEDMKKASKPAQLSILGAGVFANVVFGIIFTLLWVGLFFVTFTPSGAIYNTYSLSRVEIGSISEIGGMPIENPTAQDIVNLVNGSGISLDLVTGINGVQINFTRVIAGDNAYFMTPEFVNMLNEDTEYMILYNDLPAINAGIKGTIIEIGGNKIASSDDLDGVMKNYNPGDEVKITTRYNNEILKYDIILGSSSLVPGRALIGVGHNGEIQMNFADILSVFMRFKDPFTDYQVNHQFLLFLYYLVFWILIINYLVALFNMLPVAALDGGRFFFLTVWGITKSEKVARFAYKWIGLTILAGFLLMMLAWLFGIAS